MDIKISGGDTHAEKGSSAYGGDVNARLEAVRHEETSTSHRQEKQLQNYHNSVIQCFAASLFGLLGSVAVWAFLHRKSLTVFLRAIGVVD